MFDFFWTRIDPLEQVWTSVRLQSTTIVVMIMQMFHCSTCFWLFLWSIACDFWMSCGSQNIAISRCSSIFQRTAGWCPGNLMLRNFITSFFLFWVWTSDFSSSYSINRQSALHCHSARSTSTSPSVSLRLKRRTRIVMAHQCCCLDNSYTVSCHCWNNGHQWDWFIISVHSSYIESIHTYI